MTPRPADFDDAYANAPHIPGAERFPPAWAAAAEAFRAQSLRAGGARLDMSYGERPRSRLDLFLPNEAPLHDGTRPVVKGAQLSGQNGILYRRNSLTGAVEAVRREGVGVTFNEALHA